MGCVCVICGTTSVLSCFERFRKDRVGNSPTLCNHHYPLDRSMRLNAAAAGDELGIYHPHIKMPPRRPPSFRYSMSTGPRLHVPG